MYYIIVYDVAVERVNKVKKLLREYLHWVQNSVFEGELTDSEFEEVKSKLTKIILPEEDSVVIYYFKTKKYVNKMEIGLQKNKDSYII